MMPGPGTIALAVTVIIVSFSAIVTVIKMLAGVVSEVTEQDEEE